MLGKLTSSCSFNALSHGTSFSACNVHVDVFEILAWVGTVVELGFRKTSLDGTFIVPVFVLPGTVAVLLMVLASVTTTGFATATLNDFAFRTPDGLRRALMLLGRQDLEVEAAEQQ